MPINSHKLVESFGQIDRKKRRQARRAKFIAMLGGHCVRCGTTKNLQFDHIKKIDKTMDIANSIDTKEERLISEIKKCQLLCKKCHGQKTMDAWDFGVSPSEHGTIWMYKKYKCRCNECKKAMSDYYHDKVKSAAQLYSIFCKG